ncbi:unnamed protein product [Heterosigma akashiwo]
MAPPPALPGGRPGAGLGAPPAGPAGAKLGQLLFKCVGGKDLKAGIGMFGKADPYAKITIGAQQFTTKHHSGGGKNPEWNEEFVFEIANETEAEIEVLDKDTVGNDKFMGRCKVNIMDWISSGFFEGDVELTDKVGKPVGGITVSAKFNRPGAGGHRGELSAMVPPNMNMPQAGAGGGGEPARDPNGKFTDQEIWEAFVAFDLDKNTFVGAAEIRHVLINIGENVTDEEVDEMIRMVDRDGDGQVSFDEFYEMVTGGKKPPPGLGGRGGATAGRTGGVGPGAIVPMGAGGGGPSVVQQRNQKKAALDEFARDNSIKPETIKKAYKRYQAADSKDKSGLVDYTEFCEILQVDPSPQAEKVFQMYDYDRAGQIDIKEFLISLANFSGAGKDDKLKFAFMIFDEDGNGVITKGELTKILKSNHLAANEAEVARKSETIMAQADKDGDGVITFDEFVIVSKKFPNILFPAYANVGQGGAGRPGTGGSSGSR